MIDKSKLIMQYNVEQVYLEIARSAAECGFVNLYRKPRQAKDINFENSTRFAGVAISITFAYAAMEAFCNAHLYSICSQIQGLSEAEKKAGWSIKFRHEKHRQHFSNEIMFAELLSEELKEKLKVLASALNIPTIEDIAPKLWGEICSISRDLRNFIIHPEPSAKDFNAKMKKIMEKNAAGKYADIAARAIRHYYEKRKPSVSIPQWLDKNNIFRFLNGQDIEKAWDHKPFE